jgi:hypothetical protein
MTKQAEIQAWWDAAKPAARGVAVALANAADDTIAADTPTSLVRREYAKLPGFLQSVLASLPGAFYASMGPQVKVHFVFVRNNRTEKKEIVCSVFAVAGEVRGAITALARTGIVAFDLYVDPQPVAGCSGKEGGESLCSI